ncbi:hypothetical protein [Brevundimonas sp.]|uniref:hypothetical protein n=1 Tax=Brevundimonas sp. TaxID=1871086 RepID=UPI002FDA7F19
MEFSLPLPWVFGILGGIVICVVGWVRTRSVNTHDPLQGRLAEHFGRYLESGRSDKDKAVLVETLRSELKQRQVSRDEWRFRLSSAVDLIEFPQARNGGDAHGQAHELMQVIERLGTSS